MEVPSEVSDEDLIFFIKSILESRPFPINYKNLRDLVKEAPSHLKNYADSKYNEEKFLNFLLSNSNLFNVSPDGSVILLGGVEYVLPQAIDMLDSIPASDDSYFGDREEYISESEEESNTSMDSSHRLLASEALSNVLLKKMGYGKRAQVADAIDQIDNPAVLRCDSTSSSDSTPLYLSTDSDSHDVSTTTTDFESQSSFESCDGAFNRSQFSERVCSSTSSSYSSCSDS